MQRPLEIKKLIGFVLFVVLFLLSIKSSANAAEPVLLNTIEKQEDPGHTRIVLAFSGLPEFRSEHSGQRLDLVLAEVEPSPRLQTLPEDENVVKILLAEQKQQLMVSILLRRPPQRVIAASHPNPDRIELDIYWQEDGVSRPAVAFQIAGMPPRKAGRKASSYQRRSPWEGRWKQFFREYRQDWSVELPLNLVSVPLPPLIQNQQSPLWPLQQLADKSKFLSLLEKVAGLKGLDSEQDFRRGLLAAEAELRSGSPEAALDRLRLLQQAAGEKDARVEYLTAYGQALTGKPVVAQLTLQQQLPQLAPGDPLQPYYQLLLAETALVSGQDKAALEFLQQIEPKDRPEPLQRLVNLRRADALAGSGQRQTALTVYRELADVPGLLYSYHFSSNRAAFTAFKQQNYRLAQQLYRRLAAQTEDAQDWDLLLFAAGASAYAAGNLDWGLIDLERTVLEQPQSEGSDRARLLLADHQVISNGDPGLAQAVKEYAQLGQNSDFRPVREEARFKHALTLFLRQQYRDSVTELMAFRRNFASTELRAEVDLLLLEQLPRVVRQLIEEKNDLQAVVLVEKNRNLLLSSGYSRAFLTDLATAFDRLGLYQRAARVLLYLFDRTAGKPEQEAVYLPLARSFLKREAYTEASKYAQQYLDRYPAGEDAGALYVILLDALKQQGRADEIQAWLERSGRPRSSELERRAASIYWRLQKHARVIDSLEWIRDKGESLTVKEMALLAEAHFQSGKAERAEQLYRQLFDAPEYAARARYRSAQIRLRRQQRQEALNLLRKVVETDDSSPWVKLAQDLLIEERR